MSLPKADGWFMFAENKYVNTNQIFSDDKVASDPHQSLIYITNEVVIKKKSFFWQDWKLGVTDLQPPQCIVLHALMPSPHTIVYSEKLLWRLEATEASKSLILISSKNKLDFPESFPLFWTLTLYPQELQDCTCHCISHALHDNESMFTNPELGYSQ